MALHALGRVTVTTAGTRERLTKGETTPGARLAGCKIVVKALTTNTNPVTVGNSAVVHATGVGAYVTLSAGQEHKFGNEGAPAGLNAADFWLDVGTNGEGVVAYVDIQ
jgi:hypothetical protein